MSKPISVIETLNVPFNSTQQNVLSFNNLSQQELYFKGMVVESYPLNTTVRDDSVMVDDTFENITANYIRYKNKNKWYYGFITNIEYVNDYTTKIYYEIDSWQTYYFDIDIKQCYVEREHVVDDTIGSNTIAEPFNYEKIAITSGEAIPGYLKYYLIVNFTSDSEVGSDLERDDIRAGIVTRVVGHNKGRATGGITKVYTIDQRGLSALLRDVNALPDKGANTITSMFEVPSTFITETYDGNMNGTPANNLGKPINDLPDMFYKTTADSLSQLQSKVGYTVRNNKLLSDQFWSWELTNNAGETLETLPSEVNYNSPEYHVNIRGGQNIFGVARIDNLRVGKSTIHLTTAPLDSVSWVGSVFAENLAQNAKSRDMNMGMNALNMVSGFATSLTYGNVLGAVGSVVGGISNVMQAEAREQDMQRQKTGQRGSQNATGLSTIYANKFIWWAYGLNKYDLKRADDFLTRYGYQVNTFKVPNLRSRNDFNYIKTAECNIVGAIPSKHMEQIINMFNSGFTLWHGQTVRMQKRAMLTDEVVEYGVDFSNYMNYDSINEVREVNSDEHMES